MCAEYPLSRYINERNFIQYIRISDDDEEAFVPIKCWECGGDKGKCNDAEDLGVEKVCEKGTYTCVVARDDGTFMNKTIYCVASTVRLGGYAL